MTNPVYQIKTYTGATNDYTITSDCKFLRFKTALDEIGYFTFVLPGIKAATKIYDDIAIYDRVEIFLGYDTVPVTPLFRGVIENIDNVWEGKAHMRTFSGRDQGEIMTRLLFRQYSSAGDTAQNAVTKVASRVGMGTNIDADATAVTVVSYDGKYDAYMRQIGDYASTINKDWYVDTTNPPNLVWKSRPLRSDATVSSLTIGENIKQYTLTRNINEVFNKLWIFGATEVFDKDDPSATSACAHTQYTKAPTDLPADHDAWTDALTHWTAGSKSGTHTGPSLVGGAHCGSNMIANGVAVGLANEYIWLKRTFDTTDTIVRIKDEALLNFYIAQTLTGSGNLSKFIITLDAPNTSNYLTYNVSSGLLPPNATGTHYTLKLGPGYEVLSGVDDGWVKTGDPDWYDLEAIKFYLEYTTPVGSTVVMNVDCLYFENLRWRAIDSDGDSQANYGIREMVIVDDKLHSNTECANVGAMLKAMKKDPSIQLDLTVPLDTNILIGDRIPITIPNENLTATNFDVISVEHSLPPAETRVILVSNERTREVFKSTSPAEIIKGLKEQSSEHIQRKKIIR